MSQRRMHGDDTPAYDLFVSYAREDEDRAKKLVGQLESCGLRCFFAPRAALADDALHEPIVEAMTRSRAILLLWSPFVDKSEWMMFEAAVAATLRLPPRVLPLRFIVIDLDGPALPRWIDADPSAWIPAHAPQLIDEVMVRLSGTVATGEGEDAAHGRAGIQLLRELCRETTWDLRAWRARLRLAGPSVASTFPLARATADELERPRLLATLVGAAALAVACAVFATAFAWFFARYVLVYPHDPRGYVPGNVLTSGVAGLVLGLLLYVRTGVGPGTTGILWGVPIGLAITVGVGFSERYGKYGAIGGGATVGLVLGVAAAASLALADVERGRHNRGGWRPLLGLAGIPILMVLAGVVAAAIVGQQWPHPGPSGRLLAGVVVGGLLAVPLGYAAYWFRHLQKRRRYRRSAVGFGLAMWGTLTVAAAAVAVVVPFGEPFDPRAGLGSGLVAGVVVGAMMIFLQDAAERLALEGWATVVALLMLLACSYPVLLLFPNVQAPMVLASLIPSILVGFGATAAGQGLVSRWSGRPGAQAALSTPRSINESAGR